MYVYIVYKSKGYIGAVAGCTDVSMARAVDDGGQTTSIDEDDLMEDGIDVDEELLQDDVY